MACGTFDDGDICAFFGEEVLRRVERQQMKYFEMFTGIAGFSKGIDQAYDNHHQYESAKPEQADSTSGRFGIVDERNGSVLSANNAAFRDGGGAGMLECIGFSEIGKTPSAILKYRFPTVTNYGDATGIVCDELPDFDFLCGGFPCQSFSIAGKRQGFNEARGTLFFEIARILSHKRPRHFLLENVRGLLSSDDGKVYTTILRILADLDYRVETVVLNSKHYGVPQNRERVFFIGHLGAECEREILSFGEGDGEFNEIQRASRSEWERLSVDTESRRRDTASLESGGDGRERYGDNSVTVGTLRTHKDGEGFREMQSNVSPSLNARARQDGSQQPIIAMAVDTKNVGDARFTENVACLGANDYKEPKGVMLADKRIRRLTPVECARLQGFPDDWTDFGTNEKGETYAISDTGKYQCFGNAVTVNVIEAIVRKMIEKGCLGEAARA